MHAYAVQPSSGFIKLDAMENPFALPTELQAELGRRLGAVAINRYPGGRTSFIRTYPDECIKSATDGVKSLYYPFMDNP